MMQPIPIPARAAPVLRDDCVPAENHGPPGYRRTPSAPRWAHHDERDGEDYDLRVSVIPTKHGEAVCLRILGRQSRFLEMSQLGMEPAQRGAFWLSLPACSKG